MKYFVTFIDEKLKYIWLTLLPNKGRVFETFSNFGSYVETKYKVKIKALRTDNGGEYTSREFKDYTAKHDTPQQNETAERKNRHLMEVARTLLIHKNVPKRFWGDAVVTACYLINRLPTKVLKDMTPFEVLNEHTPNIDHLLVFGCRCFVFLPEEKRNKLEARSTDCVFIGYSSTQKGYKCYDPKKNQVIVSREVKFDETKGYFGNQNWSELKNLADSQTDRAASLKLILDNLNISNSTAGQKGSGVECSAQPHSEPVQAAAWGDNSNEEATGTETEQEAEEEAEEEAEGEPTNELDELDIESENEE